MVKSPLAELRVGYVPYDPSLQPPGDRRRFAFYAKQRGITFELATPEGHYDVVVLSARADISVWRNYQHGKVVFDLIDSYLNIPRTSLKGWLRGGAKFVARQSHFLQLDYWSALRQMCRRADAVVCTTLAQKDVISHSCNNVHVVLDAHAEDVRIIKHDYRASEPFRIVWEGLPATLDSLATIGAVLADIARNHPIELHVITDMQYPRFLGSFGLGDTVSLVRSVLPASLPVEVHTWTGENINTLVPTSDLAIIPLDLNDPFAAGKPENKLLLFWRFGIPTLTSATPAYFDAMRSANLSMACASFSEWHDKLLEYIESEDKRRSAGIKALRFIESNYSSEAILSRWDAVFASVLGHQPCAE